MSKRIDSAALREMAEALYDKIADEAGFEYHVRNDMVTSIVRQWITYERNAVLFPDGSCQYYLILRNTPLGKSELGTQRMKSEWTRFVEDWKIDPDDMPEILAQLNRGQGAEVVNSDGTRLRIYVNPKTRSRGVEALDKENLPSEPQWDIHKIAANTVTDHLGDKVSPAMKDDLIRSVVAQWQQYDGHASIFINEHRQLILEFKRTDNGGCHVSRTEGPIDILSTFAQIGFQPKDLGDALAQLNLGEEVPFHDRQGLQAFIGHNPKTRQFIVRNPGATRPRNTSSTSPLLCPKCKALLNLWREDMPKQTCPMCGEVVPNSCRKR